MRPRTLRMACQTMTHPGPSATPAARAQCIKHTLPVDKKPAGQNRIGVWLARLLVLSFCHHLTPPPPTSNNAPEERAWVVLLRRGQAGAAQPRLLA